MNITNEIIALLVGLITTVLVPFLNKRFGLTLNPTTVGTVSTEVLDEAASKLSFIAPPQTLPPATTPMPSPSTPKPLNLPVPPTENGAS